MESKITCVNSDGVVYDVSVLHPEVNLYTFQVLRDGRTKPFTISFPATSWREAFYYLGLECPPDRYTVLNTWKSE